MDLSGSNMQRHVSLVVHILPGVASQSQAEKEIRANTSVLFFSLAVLIFGC